MSRETTSQMGSSCPNSVSFPNTRMQSTKSFDMGSKVFRFQPVKSDILLKQLLEDDEESPKSERKTPKQKTSNLMSHRSKFANNDSFSSDDDADENILDKTITEDDSMVNSKDLVPGVSWLHRSPERRPLKIIAKPVPSTPMSNMFNKLSIRDPYSARKEPRSVSVDRKDEPKLLQTPASNNMFKTPSCKNSRIIPSCSTAQKLQSSERSAIPSTNNHILSARKRQLETATPKQKMPIQANKNCDTPQQNSILQAAIHRNFNTPRFIPSSAIKEEKIVSSSAKKSDVILREKNLNVVSVEKQKSREIIVYEESQPLNKHSISSEIKQIPNKQSNSNEFKQSLFSEERQLANKQLKSNELKQSLFNEEKQLANKQSTIVEDRKQSNSNEFKQSNSREEKQLQNKQNNSAEVKQPNVQISIPTKSLQESTLKQLKVKGKDYIIINKIGEGGSGQVYRCLEQETLQDRAIKVVNLNVDATTKNSYINEVKMLKDLQGNDRVIRMYDFEIVNQNLLVVMEKGDVDFSIFSRNVTAESQIQTHIIVCYWIEMLKCVREIHKQGIIHSDLKPSNFLLVCGRLKLIDFGIASRLTADMTSVIKNVTVGTFNYISPEALLDSRECTSPDEKPQLRISYKSDVWSLGCILYQMVYKRTPFQSTTNIWAKFTMITDRNHKIEYQQIPGVPTYLIDMIKKCLVYDMRSRPTVEELLNMYYSGNYY